MLSNALPVGMLFRAMPGEDDGKDDSQVAVSSGGGGVRDCKWSLEV